MNLDIKSHRWAARLFGIFIILAFASYGTGSGLVDSIAEGTDGLAGIADGKTTLMIGVVLIATVHTVVTIGLSVLAFPALSTVNGYAARGYLAAGIAATVTAVTGALFLALLVPLSDAFVASGTGAEHFDTMALILQKGGFFAYQMSMTLWSVGGLILCAALFVSRLVPRFLSVWGLVGYIVFMVGTIAEVFGHPIGVMLSPPAGLFELSLSVWLIVKGFNLPAVEKA
jgi:hypothetical protein